MLTPMAASARQSIARFTPSEGFGIPHTGVSLDPTRSDFVGERTDFFGWQAGLLTSLQSMEGAIVSNLVVLGFDGIHTADEVLNKARALQKEYLIDLEDACVVEREKDGKIYIKQAVNLTSMGAVRGGTSGALWGALVGLLFLNPLAGMAIGALAGAGAGALAGSLTDYGISDDFVKNLGKTIPVESSALFVLVKSATTDKILPVLEPYKPRILQTSLSSEQEERLRTALSKAA